MPEYLLHPATLPVEQLLKQCEIRRQKRSGPGGQHRNKVETAVIITHTKSGIKGEASERRSQEQNRQVALFRLRMNLALSLRQPPCEEYSPSPLWQSRCRSKRISVSTSHDDFPALMAEVLDLLQACDYELKLAVQSLNVSVSQLTKLLKDEPRAIALVNKHRSQLGLRPLR